jgi:hypothetical protein
LEPLQPLDPGFSDEVPPAPPLLPDQPLPFFVEHPVVRDAPASREVMHNPARNFLRWSFSINFLHLIRDFY